MVHFKSKDYVLAVNVTLAILTEADFDVLSLALSQP